MFRVGMCLSRDSCHHIHHTHVFRLTRRDLLRFMPQMLPKGPKKHDEERVVPFPVDLVYQVVSDVARYKEFVPYTLESRILRQSPTGKEMIAELCVGFGGLKERYQSRVVCDPIRKKVTAQAADSMMFEKLLNRWEFLERPLDRNSCLLKFGVEFQFKSALHAGMANLFFDRLSKTMVDAFITRCETVQRENEERNNRKQIALKQQRVIEEKNNGKKRKKTNHKSSKEEDHTLLGELELLSHFSIDELKRIKRNFDRSAGHDNNLDLDTFCELFAELFHDSGYSPVTLNRCAIFIFQNLDSNRDGKLNLREFTAGLSTVVKGNSMERCMFWFDCFDKNCDGLVNREELTEMIRTSFAVRKALIEAGVANMNHKNFVVETDVESIVQDALTKCFHTDDEHETVSLQQVLEMKII